MKSRDNNLEENNLLVEKYSKGLCSQEEALDVVNNFKKPKLQNKLFTSLSTLWTSDFEVKDTSEEKEPNLSPILEKIHQRINYSKISETVLTKRINTYKVWLKVAAVFFVPLIILSVLYVYDNLTTFGQKDIFTEVCVPNGSKLHTVLPDGTGVWLNSGSTLKYPEPFSRKNRKVTLIGEAYFDVVSDISHPFFVTTEAYIIKVTGTRFNVMAYPNEDIISTTLEKGKISIEQINEQNEISLISKLDIKEHLVYQKSSKTFRKMIVNTDQFTSWKDGKLIFRNNSLEFIVSKLERWYNADIELVGDDSISSVPYTMNIENESLDQVLEYITLASGISREVVPPKRMKNGEFSKKKYILHK